MKVGKISEVWRYPVKSMAGERIASAQFDAYGMIGDRAWAAIDSSTGDVGWGKSHPKLMNLQARYTHEPLPHRAYCEDVPPVAINFPAGEVALSEGNADVMISDYIGAPLQLRPLEPPENREHYRWQKPADYESLLKILGIGPNDPPPDMSAYSESTIELLAEYFSPPGTYNDMFPVHMLTSSSIEHMEHQSGETFQLQRFRPNLLIDTEAGVKGLIEFDWIGRSLTIGESQFKVESKTIRCSMPARAQAPYGLEQNPAIAKSLFLETQRFFGAYLSITKPGNVQVGDDVILSD